MSKKIKETDINYSVKKDQLADIAPEIDKVADDGDSIEVTEADINYSVSKDNLADVTPELEKAVDDGDTVQVTEALKIGIHPILNSLGIDLSSKSPEEKQSIKSMIKQFVDILNQRGVTNLVLREDEDELPEIPDEERMERGDEYGVHVYEDFDKIMEELKSSNAPRINIKEGVRPRITKNDLINYIKSKK